MNGGQRGRGETSWEATSIIPLTDDDDLDQRKIRGRGDHEKCSLSAYILIILKVELREFASGWNIKCERRRESWMALRVWSGTLGG